MVGAQATNEEAFALKRLMLDTIGSDRLAMVSFTPPGLSGDDNFLLRANKNPNTRGLEAMGIPPAHFSEFGKAVAAGELKMLILMRTDLLGMMGETEFIRDFSGLDYLVVLDTDASETAQMANQVLPIGAYPETDGSFTNFKGRVQRLSQAFPPPGDALTRESKRLRASATLSMARNAPPMRTRFSPSSQHQSRHSKASASTR